MKKKILKIFWVLNIIIICTLFLNIPSAYASGFDKIFKGANNFIEEGDPSNAIPGGEDAYKDMSSILYNVLFTIGVVIAVIVGIWIGIQFMTSGVEQKAKVKETLIAYVVGCIVIFGAFTIWKLVVTILQSTQ